MLRGVMLDVKSGLHMKSYAEVIWWNFLAVWAMRRFAANDESAHNISLVVRRRNHGDSCT